MGDLQAKLSELCEAHGVPGAVAGVVIGGETHTAVWGVTNLEHPLPVTEETLFQFGSTGKTLTATAVMVLVERGDVDLDAPVRTYVPELVLQDEAAAAKVTVLQLLNHTAGWSGDKILETGDGDDALERYVGLMADFEQISPLGQTVSYNNASLSLAGRLIEKVTGKTYEQAVRDLVLDPLGLAHTFGFAKEIMTLSFASGHARGADGELAVSRPWALPRSGAPAGGWTATVADQLAWARFHLGVSGSTLLSEETRLRMQTPTVEMPGNALGDAVGISWLLQDLGDGLVQVSHGGSTLGQLSSFDMVPARDFAVVCMTNASPNGAEVYGALHTWALEHYLGVTQAEPEFADLCEAELDEYAGEWLLGSSATCLLEPADGKLVARITITDRTLIADGEPAEQPPVTIGLLAGDRDRFVVAEGDGKGMRGYFTRDDAGAVALFNFSGRDLVRA